MGQAHDELNALYQEFRNELNRLAGSPAEDLDPLDVSRLGSFDQVTRRLIVRSAFAAIDALAFRLKQVALQPDVSFRLLPAERAICAEEAYELDSDGQAQVRPARLRFLSNLRFAFAVAAKADDAAFSLELSGRGWQAVQKGARVRDRLMHPKSTADLLVADHEIRSCVEAFSWIEEQLIGWLEAGNRAKEERITALQREAEGLRSRIRGSAV